jgi:hypothetical protein
MKIKVPTLNAQQANIQTIDIGQVVIGPISVDTLTLSNADFTMSAAQGVLSQVKVSISIHISVEWHVHVGLPDGIPDIDIGDTYDLGSIGFGPINIGNVVIPGLNNIKLHIPSLTAQNITAAPSSPVTIQLKNVTADNINAANFTLPSAGFSIAGMSLTSAQGSGLGVPAANMDQATIGHLHGNPVKIPAFALGNINMAAAQIPDISSSAPLDIPAILPTQSPGFDAGILRLFLHLTPSALMHIDHLDITNAKASATVNDVVLNNVTIPYDVMNLKLSDIGINTLTIPSINIA